MAHEQDIVLIYFEDKPYFFARIESIVPDQKPNWYHVKLLVLGVPLKIITWILRDRYIVGEEFTMDGNRIRMEKVVCPPDESPEQYDRGNQPVEKEKDRKPAKNSGNVISFSKFQK